MEQHATEGALEAEYSPPIDIEPVQSRDLVGRLLESERYDDAERVLLAKLAQILGVDSTDVRGHISRGEIEGVMAECHIGGVGTPARLLLSIWSSEVHD
ncbi:MAG: hypothetical protein O3B65_04940 [Chloroflexi bacterium]|nr:hypothetical protein [Chloroflexota bacterium]